MSDRANRTGPHELRLTPGLADLIRVAVRNAMLEVRTHTVCTVKSYDPVKQRVNVVVDQRQRIKDPNNPRDPNATFLQPPAPLDDIPVAWPRTKAGSLTFPLVPGDKGELHVQDRALDGYLVAGLPSEPARQWTHNLADSTFHPCLYHDAAPLNPPTGTDQDATVLDGDKIKIGQDADKGAARTDDAVKETESMKTWITAVGAALNGLGVPVTAPLSFGTIEGGSTKVQVE
jgi:hypothetical protein